MTSPFDQGAFAAVAALITFVGTVIGFTVFHFRILRILRALIARLPLALHHDIIRDASTTEEKPMIEKRGSPRVSCHFFVKKEHFNEKLDDAIHGYHRASTYPLKSRVSVAAVGLWFLIVVVVGVYFIGNLGTTQSNASSAVAATNQPSLLNIQTNAQTGQIVTSGATATPAALTNKSDDNLTFKNRSLVIAAIGAGVALFAVCLVLCYHYGVYLILIEDVVTLCETVGLVTVKSTTDGKALIDRIIPAKDDPEFNALLRLTKKKG